MFGEFPYNNDFIQLIKSNFEKVQCVATFTYENNKKVGSRDLVFHQINYE